MIFLHEHALIIPISRLGRLCGIKGFTFLGENKNPENFNKIVFFLS